MSGRLCALFAAAGLLAAAAPAGAATYDSGAVSLSCTALGNTVGLTAVVTTTAPSSLTPGESFTPSVQVALALPSTLYAQLSGLGLSSVAIALSALPVDAVGATPGALNWFATPQSASVTTASAPSSVAIPASPVATGAYAVTTAGGGQVTLTLDPGTDGVKATALAGQLSLPIDCSAPSPAVVLAQIPVSAPQSAGGGGGAGTAPGTSTTTAPDRSPTDVAPRLVGAAGKLVRVHLACPAGKSICRVRLRLATRPPRSVGLAGSLLVSLAGGEGTTITLRLSSTGDALLRRRHRLATLLTVVAHDSYGDPRTTTLAVRLTS